MSASARTGPPGPAGPAGPTGPAGASADLSGEAAARQAADATLTAAAAAAQATATAALPKAGGTMTGKIVLDGDPTANLHPATKQWVAAQITALINGAPSALDTLKEIADQLSTDESAVTALTATVTGKLAAASNLSDLANAVTARTNLGLGSAATHPATDFDTTGAAAAAQAASQPLDSDLTAIAALTTTAFGRGLLTQADATALLTAIGAVATGDARLSDTRTPTDSSVTNAKVAAAAAIAYSKLALTGTIQVADLAFDPATQTELDAEAALRVSGDAAAIAKSLVDAKGDLLVGTADNVVARTAVGADGQVLTANSAQTAGVAWATPGGWYGDGADGDVTISANTTLARDMYYNNLTVNTGIFLNSAGFRVFVKNTLTLNGSITGDGYGPGNVFSTGSFAANAGTYLGGISTGATGGTGAGAAAGSSTEVIGGAGGAGGAGTSGAGGAGGTVSTPNATRGDTSIPRTPFGAYMMAYMSPAGTFIGTGLKGGAGGGAGAGDGTNAGGSGGGGGGICVVFARIVAGTGLISAKGGNGAQPSAGNTGGGGGGGGGGAVLVTSTASPGTTLSAAGGAGGAARGTGSAGSAGSAGRTYLQAGMLG